MSPWQNAFFEDIEENGHIHFTSLSLKQNVKEKTFIYAKYLYLATTFEDWKPC